MDNLGLEDQILQLKIANKLLGFAQDAVRSIGKDNSAEELGKLSDVVALEIIDLVRQS